MATATATATTEKSNRTESIFSKDKVLQAARSFLETHRYEPKDEVQSNDAWLIADDLDNDCLAFILVRARKMSDSAPAADKSMLPDFEQVCTKYLAAHSDEPTLFGKELTFSVMDFLIVGQNKGMLRFTRNIGR